jgi:hypothetical protein
VRWLRPDYQIETLGPLTHRAGRVQAIGSLKTSTSKLVFPAEKKAQAGQVLQLLERSRSPLSADQIAARFRNRGEIETDVLASLSCLGDIESFDNDRSYIRISA